MGVNTLPLVIGVAAPPDPGEAGPVHLAVEAFFRELARLCPHTPLRLLSCLGEPGDYRIAKAAEVLHPAEVRLVVLRDPSRLGVPISDPDGRDARYKALAPYVARQCHLLLAVWDGDEQDAADGVAELVRCKLHGVPDEGEAEWTPLDSPEGGPVYLIRPLRPATDDASAGTAAPYEKRFPPPPDAEGAALGSDPARAEEAERAYEAILARVDKFNQDITETLPSLESMRLDSRDSLLLEDDDRKKPLDEQRRVAEDRVMRLPPAARTALDHFAATDALALHFQKRTHWVMRALFVSALLAMIVFEVQVHSQFILAQHTNPTVPAGHEDHFPRDLHHWGIFAYLACWALGLGLWWFCVHRTDYQNRRQDYRALAEGLRVQFFWRVAGLPDRAEDHYLRKQRSELEWIRYALHTWNALGTDDEKVGAAGPAPGLEERMRFVQRYWVQLQQAYFRRSARREQDRHLRWHRAGDVLFGINLLGAAGLFVVLLVIDLSSRPPLRHEVEHGWVLGLGLAVIAAALCVGYTEKLAHAQHGKQYLTMRVLFDRASTALEKVLGARPPDPAGAARILRELGKEALAENADWLLMHRERPLEVPRP